MIQIKLFCGCGNRLHIMTGCDGPKVYGIKVELIVEPCKKCSKRIYNRGHIEGEMFRDKVRDGLKPVKVKYK